MITRPVPVQLIGLGMLLACVTQGFLAQAQTPAALMVDSSVGSISFGADDVKVALEQNGYSVTTLSPGNPSGVAQSVRIILTTQAAGVPGMPVIAGITSQGYAIQKVVEGSATNWWVIGHDAPGVMYGGLELAESVKLANGLAGVTNRQVNPYMTQRGIKFNIPLDARSPSYSDDSSSAQANITNVWEKSFWENYFDSMARNRYNLLSLWNLHPFPSMVRVPEYPDVALADVKMKTGAMWNATLNGMKMYDDEWELTTVKTMTVDEKIAFWRWVMQYAQDRGIQLYVFTWNIFVCGTEPSGYGITDKSTNPITTDYFRKSVKAMFNTYPLLAGIGLTTGENMGGRTTTTAEKEQWAWDTYGQGIADAVADSKNPESPFYAPSRVVRLIHRLHQTEPAEVANFFQGLPGVNDADSTLSFSSKYNKAHMLSTTQSVYSDADIAALPPGMKTFLTIRNDDLYCMRWGDPDFARDYIVNIPQQSKIAGYYMGPDGYTWGREYVSTEPDTPRQLVMDKMWYYFSLFGRLSFDPTMPNSRFEAILAERFPEVSSADLFQGWASVSKVIPLISRFYWGSLDFHWYPEACWSSLGFHSVSNLITKYKPMNANQTHEKPYFMSVEQYVKGDAANGRLTPLEVADLLQQHADAGWASVQSLSPGSNKELRLTLGDIKAQAWLGRYYAEKIRGAVALHRYQTTGVVSHHAEARTHLIEASNHWKEYAALWSTQYIEQVLGRMESAVPLNIAGLQAAVDADIPPPLDNSR